MIRSQLRSETRGPALTRLMALAPLDEAAVAALGAAMEEAHAVRVRRDIITEGREITQALLLLSGWAARVRLLPDGRRQFLSFLLPGDLIGACDHPNALAVSTVVAMSDVQVCPLPVATSGSPLHIAYAVSRAMEEGHLLAQITRLGRLNAQERISDLLLELHERQRLRPSADAGDAGRCARAHLGPRQPHVAAGAARGRPAMARRPCPVERSGRTGPQDRPCAGARHRALSKRTSPAASPR